MFRMHQTKIGECFMHPNYLWMVYKITTDLDANTSKEEYVTTVCQECSPAEYVEILRHAVKIESITMDERRNIAETS